MSGEVIADLITKIVGILLFIYALSTAIIAFRRNVLEDWMCWLVAVFALNIVAIATTGILHAISFISWMVCTVICLVLMLKLLSAMQARSQVAQRDFEEIKEIGADSNQRLSHYTEDNDAHHN